jgi:hypothetical protein
MSETNANPLEPAVIILKILGFTTRTIFADHPQILVVIAATPITWNFLIKSQCCPMPFDCSFRLDNHFAVNLAAACINPPHGSDDAIGDSTRFRSNLDIGACWIDATAATTRHSAVIVIVHELSNGIPDAVNFRRIPYAKTKVANVFTHRHHFTAGCRPISGPARLA